MSVLTDLIQALSGGAAEHFEEKDFNRRENQQYKKKRARALTEDSEDYQRGLKRRLNEDSIMHDIGLVRDEAKYRTNRGRTLNERVEDRKQKQVWDEEDYRDTRRKANRDKAEKLLIAEDLAKKFPDDTGYIGRATAGIHGIEKPIAFGADGSIIGPGGKGIGGGSDGLKLFYNRRKMVSEEMERLMKTLQTGQGLDDFGNPTGVPLSEAQKRIMLDELTNLQGEYSELTQAIYNASRGESGGQNPLQTIVDGFNKIFAGEPAQPGAATPAPTPGAQPTPTPAPQPGVAPQNPAAALPTPAASAPIQPRMEELFGGIRYDANTPVLRFLRQLVAMSKDAANSGKKLPPLPFGHTNAFSGSLPGRSY